MDQYWLACLVSLGGVLALLVGCLLSLPSIDLCWHPRIYQSMNQSLLASILASKDQSLQAVWARSGLAERKHALVSELLMVACLLIQAFQASQSLACWQAC